MTNIIKFPEAGCDERYEQPEEKAVEQQSPTLGPTHTPLAAKIVRGLVAVVWTVLVLVWPVLKWVISIDVAWQFARMVFLWKEPGAHAGWTFLTHFAVLTALTWFVMYYRPRKL